MYTKTKLGKQKRKYAKELVFKQAKYDIFISLYS